MSTHPSEGPLPTLNKLGTTLPTNIDPVQVASEWIATFAKYAESSDVSGVLSLLVSSDFSSTAENNASSALSLYWRDLLAFTWDFRTFEGTQAVKTFLNDRLALSGVTKIRLRIDGEHATPVLESPFPDMAWIRAMFTFETEAGIGSGIVRLVPTPPENSESGGTVWKAHSIFTNLDDLKDFPEKLGPLRNHNPNHGTWEQDRTREAQFLDKDPVVLVIGGGQSGLEVAARLKSLDVSCLVVEKNVRVGDNWRNRYEALCLHDPVWYDHLPYLPFPATWPVFIPAKKLGNWLEYYAEAMELNVWTSTTVTSALLNDNSHLWSVTVRRQDGSERVFTVKHVVFAMGFKGGDGYIPTYPGMDNFKGQILHSTQHGKATDHTGKKVVVVGSCTSAHDICVDYYNYGVDVTMYQRSSTYIMSTKHGIKMLMQGVYEEGGPPTDLADRINASYPLLMNVGIAYRATKLIAEADKETLDGLRQRGFRTNMGVKDTGVLLLVWGKAGGYYLDVGGSQYIIDGKIKLKNDSQIESFTEKGLKFENGSELPADVVVFSTGLSDTREGIRKICGDRVADGCKQLWGLNAEGEINGCWRDLGFPGLWYMMGNLALCRFHSKHLALQIKAIEEGIFGERYSMQE